MLCSARQPASVCWLTANDNCSCMTRVIGRCTSGGSLVRALTWQRLCRCWHCRQASYRCQPPRLPSSSPCVSLQRASAHFFLVVSCQTETVTAYVLLALTCIDSCTCTAHMAHVVSQLRSLNAVKVLGQATWIRCKCVTANAVIRLINFRVQGLLLLHACSRLGQLAANADA